MYKVNLEKVNVFLIWGYKIYQEFMLTEQDKLSINKSQNDDMPSSTIKFKELHVLCHVTTFDKFVLKGGIFES